MAAVRFVDLGLHFIINYNFLLIRHNSASELSKIVETIEFVSWVDSDRMARMGPYVHRPKPNADHIKLFLYRFAFSCLSLCSADRRLSPSTRNGHVCLSADNFRNDIDSVIRIARVCAQSQFGWSFIWMHTLYATKRTAIVVMFAVGFQWQNRTRTRWKEAASWQLTINCLIVFFCLCYRKSKKLINEIHLSRTFSQG